ncbi:PHOsphatase [Clydaea vesicula]|uniref:Multiple inositol polyphosphate phosphatase 1 n=1 Tax=Clydaea vesicula TaxID=447962 RepID=A0AAD5TXC1_9FUNG|nr:PHOsphatase [Clydaea vesicula]
MLLFKLIFTFCLILLNTATGSDQLFSFLGSKRFYPAPAVNPKIDNQCKLLQVQLVSRHGTRNPTDVEEYINLQKFIGDHEGLDDFLKNWHSPFDPKMEGELLLQGKIEMMQLAQRALLRYAGIIDPNSTEVQSTYKSRVINSAKYFTEAAFGAAAKDIPIKIGDKNRDIELRFFDSCQDYLDLHSNGSSIAEVNKFIELSSNRLKQSILNSAKLKNLTDEHISSLYTLCAYQFNFDPLNSKDDGFCKYLSMDNLKDLEYINDLETYYEYGYGYVEIHRKMTCALITSIVNNIKSSIKSGFPKSVLKFGHGETITPLLVALGLYKDSFPLTASTRDNNRKFIISTVAPFGSNVWIELYKCGTEDDLMLLEKDSKVFPPQVYTDYKIRIMHNEVPVTLKGCGNSFCSLDKFFSLVEDLVGCDFDKVCSN